MRRRDVQGCCPWHVRDDPCYWFVEARDGADDQDIRSRACAARRAVGSARRRRGLDVGGSARCRRGHHRRRARVRDRAVGPGRARTGGRRRRGGHRGDPRRPRCRCRRARRHRRHPRSYSPGSAATPAHRHSAARSPTATPAVAPSMTTAPPANEPPMIFALSAGTIASGPARAAPATSPGLDDTKLRARVQRRRGRFSCRRRTRGRRSRSPAGRGCARVPVRGAASGDRARLPAGDHRRRRAATLVSARARRAMSDTGWTRRRCRGSATIASRQRCGPAARYPCGCAGSCSSACADAWPRSARSP